MSKALIKIKQPNRFYEIYINRTGTETPVNFAGIVTVLEQSDDKLIENWCYKKLGIKWRVHQGTLKEVWRYKQINIDNLMAEDRFESTIKRKNE